MSDPSPLSGCAVRIHEDQTSGAQKTSSRARVFLHSLRVLWSFTGLLGFIGFLFIGLRTREKKWVKWGLVYLALSGFFVALLIHAPDQFHPVIGVAFLLFWLCQVAHTFETRRRYLQVLRSRVNERMPTPKDRSLILTTPADDNLGRSETGHSDSQDLTGAIEACQTLVLTGENGLPLIELLPGDRSVDLEQSGLPVQDLSLVQQLSPILSPVLQQIPSMGMAYKHFTSLVAVFRPEAQALVKEGLSSGALTWVRTQGGVLPTVADTARGQFTNQVVLKSGVAANPAMVGVLVRQIMAMITAQKFLSDINSSLGEIEKGIQEIKEWLENERVSHIQGVYDYIREIAQSARNGQLNPDRLTSLYPHFENVELRLGQISRAIENEFDSC